MLINNKGYLLCRSTDKVYARMKEKESDHNLDLKESITFSFLNHFYQFCEQTVKSLNHKVEPSFNVYLSLHPDIFICKQIHQYIYAMIYSVSYQRLRMSEIFEKCKGKFIQNDIMQEKEIVAQIADFISYGFILGFFILEMPTEKNFNNEIMFLKEKDIFTDSELLENNILDIVKISSLIKNINDNDGTQQLCDYWVSTNRENEDIIIQMQSLEFYEIKYALDTKMKSTEENLTNRMENIEKRIDGFAEQQLTIMSILIAVFTIIGFSVYTFQNNIFVTFTPKTLLATGIYFLFLAILLPALIYFAKKKFK